VIHAAAKYSAKQKGVDPPAIGGIEAPTPNLPDQLKAGRIDAVEALEPIASQLMATNFYLAGGLQDKLQHDVIVHRDG